MCADQLPPIVAETTVPVTATQAFVGFTAQMGEWWDPLLTPDAATYTSIEIDPEGEVAMVHGEERYAWGRVTTWEPDHEYAQTFWLGHAEQSPTRLRVTFTGSDDEQETTVRLEHGGWEPGTEEVRAKYTHWDDLLARYAAFVS